MDDCDSDTNPESANNVINCLYIKMRHDPCILE